MFSKSYYEQVQSIIVVSLQTIALIHFSQGILPMCDACSCWEC